MIHKIKLREDYIQPVLSGEKNFEIRLNDKGYQKGDFIKFQAVSREGCLYVDMELEKKIYEITYVHSGLGLKENYVVFGIKEAKQEAAE